ncbi:CASP-like protein 4B3 isoform X2 [Cryptomeria japonica]|uniref:CASP-like protein 4B3 isoform X2 n=1 Tax=Cryptomeria japonica TaxID=3369 RepID=UPI0027DAB523|nr:CASP-like protein 4B3 isoform X2 [Cryptomeria japonica]
MVSRTPSPSAPLGRPGVLELSNYPSTSGASQAELHTIIAVQKQQRENRIRLANLLLRSAGLLFSFLSFVIMAANNQNRPGPKFDDYEEFRYCLASAVIAFVYFAAQLGRGIYDVVWGYNLFRKTLVSSMDFIGDQLCLLRRQRRRKQITCGRMAILDSQTWQLLR